MPATLFLSSTGRWRRLFRYGPSCAIHLGLAALDYMPQKEIRKRHNCSKIHRGGNFRNTLGISQYSMSFKTHARKLSGFSLMQQCSLGQQLTRWHYGWTDIPKKRVNAVRACTQNHLEGMSNTWSYILLICDMYADHPANLTVTGHAYFRMDVVCK